MTSQAHTILRNVFALLILVTVVSISLARCSSSPASTATPIPTLLPTATPAPTPTPTPAYTVCVAGCDFTTIQAAIDDPRVAPGDVIGVSDSVHTEAGVLLHKSLTIQGQGVEDTIVQAHASVDEASERVFRVASGVTVTLRAMTIRHGHPSECPKSGGGISNEGALTLENVRVSNNVAGAGGGIMNNGPLTLVNCTISDNRAEGSSDGYQTRGSGGGIKSMTGPMLVISSTISGNYSHRNGGGVKVSCFSTLELVDSAISGNNAHLNGGGLEVRGVVTLTHSAISGNSADGNGGGVYFKGDTRHTRGILNYANTIIADNDPIDCVLGDNAAIGLNEHNQVGDGSCSGE